MNFKTNTELIKHIASLNHKLFKAKTLEDILRVEILFESNSYTYEDEVNISLWGKYHNYLMYRRNELKKEMTILKFERVLSHMVKRYKSIIRNRDEHHLDEAIAFSSSVLIEGTRYDKEMAKVIEETLIILRRQGDE